MMWQQILAFLIAKRTAMLFGVLLIAVLILANGIHILAKGRIAPNFSNQPGKVLPYSSRVVLAAFYFAIAVCLTLLVWRFRMDLI